MNKREKQLSYFKNLKYLDAIIDNCRAVYCSIYIYDIVDPCLLVFLRDELISRHPSITFPSFNLVPYTLSYQSWV